MKYFLVPVVLLLVTGGSSGQEDAGVVRGGEDEIMPTKAERSYWPTADFPPELSVDMDLTTYSQSTSDNTGINWYRLSFDNVYCIKEIFWISDEPYWIKWRCTKEDCSECHSLPWVQEDCTKLKGSEISAEVSTAGTPSQCVDSGSNCKCGDTVFIQHKMRDLPLYVKEFVVKQASSCKTLDPAWKNIVVGPSLPVPHGQEITLSCPADHVNEGSNKATCQDGTLVPTDTPPLCSFKNEYEKISHAACSKISLLLFVCLLLAFLI